MAARIVLQQILQNEQRRSRSNARGSRTNGNNFSMDAGQEEDGFLQVLKSSIEARVPSVHGAPAGTGGTGNTGEEDSSSQDGRVKARDGPYEAGAVEATSFESLSDQEESTPKQRCLIISPRAPWKVGWDVFIGVLIIYTIITLTWRIGFDQEARGAALAFEYSVDVLFAVDTILCFRTGFFILSGHAHHGLVGDCKEVLYDVLSLRSPLMVPDRSAGPGLHGPEQLWDEVQVEMLWECSAESPEVLRSVKLMKFVRIVRLAKLIRLFKLNRFLVILEEKLHLKPAMIRMVRLIINIVFLAHLLACMWHFIALPACGVENEDVLAIGPCPEELDDSEFLPNWIRSHLLSDSALTCF
eukprot:symbB.v1.2.021592.t1/scaffold1832.1/size99513/8